MRTIWKFELELLDRFQLTLPIGAKLLTFQQQNHVLCLWAEVNSDAHLEELEFRIVGTGHDLGEDDRLEYVGTAQQGPFVWHLFKVLN